MTDRQKNDLQSHISTICKILPDVADLRDYEYTKIFSKAYDNDYESFSTMSYSKSSNEISRNGNFKLE